MTLLLFFLIIIAGWLLLRYFTHRVEVIMRDPVSYFTERQEREERRSRRRGATLSDPPRRHRKRVGREVGSYVHFTETEESQSADSETYTETNVRAEERVTDVTWEDLPDN